MNPSTSILNFYRRIRAQTTRITENLSPEDMMLQSMEDASPTKWHLAHTTWFFERFLLAPHCARYRVFDDQFNYLFNSYYEVAGERHPRARRGLLSRPSLEHVVNYRQYVDAAVENFLQSDAMSPLLENIVTTGIHHEMQHQELIITDILHAFSCNPLFPPLRQAEGEVASHTVSAAMHQIDGGLVLIGASTEQGFSYDCEQPRHSYFLQPYRLMNRLVTNREWLEFMHDGGYEQPMLWLSDGWAAREKYGWQSPLYWQQREGDWFQFGVNGLRSLVLEEPVAHISYYEADAFARWADKRLPTEHEWEYAFANNEVAGNLLESMHWQPLAAESGIGLLQGYGDVWEWTSSSYCAYPGFQAAQGPLQEYNGKFMANQFVLKGGSCVTPAQQLRPSYRNFFYPHQRWQFCGLRLAEAD